MKSTLLNRGNFRLENAVNFSYFFGFVFLSWQLLNGWVRPGLVDHPSVFWIADMVGACILPFMCYLYQNSKIAWPSADFKTFKRIMIYFALGIVINLIITAPFELLEMPKWTQPVLPFDYKVMIFEINTNRFGFFVAKFYLALSAAIFEEWFYRCYLNRIFAPALANWTIRTILISLLFSLVHWESGLYNIFIAFVLGFLFAWIYKSKKALTPIIVIHFTVNFLSAI